MDIYSLIPEEVCSYDQGLHEQEKKRTPKPKMYLTTKSEGMPLVKEMLEFSIRKIDHRC
jgi:hypothetical protein